MKTARINNTLKTFFVALAAQWRVWRHTPPPRPMLRYTPYNSTIGTLKEGWYQYAASAYGSAGESPLSYPLDVKVEIGQVIDLVAEGVAPDCLRVYFYRRPGVIGVDQLGNRGEWELIGETEVADESFVGKVDRGWLYTSRRDVDEFFAELREAAGEARGETLDEIPQKLTGLIDGQELVTNDGRRLKVKTPA